MVRCAAAVLFALLGMGCAGKPSADSVARRPVEAPPAAHTAPRSATSSEASSQPVGTIEARAALAAGTAEPPKPPIPHEAVAEIPGILRILSAVASPTSDDIFVLAQTSQDSYGGAFFVVRQADAKATVETVLTGTNAAYSDAPVWSPDGATAYFTFDPGYTAAGESKSGNGLLAWERATGKVTQVLSHTVGGLAISDDGKLAGFWDYTLGNKLTVYSLERKQVLRSWGGQTHSADDLVIHDVLFTPGGKSLLARLYVPREDPVMEYDVASGKMGPFSENIQSMAAAGDTLYFLQFALAPGNTPRQPHRLAKWKDGALEPVTVLEDFPYFALRGSARSPWLIAGSVLGYATGTAVYETRSAELRTAGKSCASAIVTSSGRILYVFGNELVADPAVCSGPPPARAVVAE